MNYLFDTCVISEVIRPKPAAKVLRWLEQIPNDRIYLSVLTLGELRKGILRLGDSRKARRLQTWLDNDVRARFGSRILSVDAEVALEWGRLCAEAEAEGHPRPTVDALLAATAIAHHLTLVTRNTADVAFTRADVFNPWE
ncbi:MAG: type II toxin-antitoxin system VapC family toxin [bacterium]